MQFTQIEFLLLFLLLLLVVWRCESKSARNSVLLFFSYYFYAYWDIRFCGLLALSTVTDFFIARAIAKQDSPTAKKRLLLASVAANLGVLGFFKYFNFFIESASTVLSPLGWNPGTLNIILPVGISFYTFQTLSYTIDVYRGKIQPTGSMLDFALYVAFFPQLVAGPIVRASELLPQLATSPAWSSRRFYGGFQMMLRGMAKKVLLADRMGEMADVVFAGPELYSGWTVWIAVFAYAGQIYYDFSGYTDMAIGVAKMLGYRFPANFRHPYLSTSLSQFWRRWHMTLSRWLRDYVYISLGGSRTSERRTTINLLITMLLGGLWHGAAWTFVLWGLWHGLALSVERRLRRSGQIRGSAVGSTITTLSVVIFGWILFRCETLSDVASVLCQMAFVSPGISWFPPLALLAITCMVMEHTAWTTRLRVAMRMKHEAWYTPITTTVLVGALVLYAPKGFTPFVYFQF